MKKQSIEELIAYYANRLNVPGPADLDYIAQTHGHSSGTGQYIHDRIFDKPAAAARDAVVELMTVAESRDLTMYEVAKRAKMPQSTISRIWSNEQMPSLATYIRLCAAIGHSPKLSHLAIL